MFSIRRRASVKASSCVSFPLISFLFTSQFLSSTWNHRTIQKDNDMQSLKSHDRVLTPTSSVQNSLNWLTYIVKRKQRTWSIAHSIIISAILDSPSSAGCALSASREGDAKPPPRSLVLHRVAMILGQPCLCTSPVGPLSLESNCFTSTFSDTRTAYKQKYKTPTFH